MPICPICNGLRTIQVTCPKCKSNMLDQGRIMDFYDDYSPYMEIDLMKLEDGYPNSYRDHQCPHLYSCPTCLTHEVLLLKEQLC